MTDFTSKEMLEIIHRVLDENSARMAEKYGITRRPKPTSDKPAQVMRQPALVDTPK